MLVVFRLCPLSWLMSPEPTPQTIPVKTIDEIVMLPEIATVSSPVDFILDRMKVDSTARTQVEEMTRGQADNPLWNICRKGRLTASNFGPAIRCIINRRKPSQSVLNSILGNKDLSGMRAIQWGKNNENTARKLYEEVYEVSVEERGLILHDSGVLGASPDGMVSKKVIEIKCPYSLRDQSVNTALDGKFFVGKIGPGEYELNLSDPAGFNYYHQVQGVMHLTDTSECDFIVWCPTDFVIFTVEKDDVWGQYIPKLIDFYKQYVLPKILHT